MVVLLHQRQIFLTVLSLFRSRSSNFRDHVIAPYDGLPDVGTVFAVLVENKWFRAIRTHSEVINDVRVHHRE